ncbi:hypothetical protein DFH94DRAFT_206292 [Russula ochroleuca]|uniref:Uncharacterized protein n=1 Tax=Russula ochroleuca TaxID=152965 RepID=A0A9P5JY31_9AGAM|nr:hypothetical protein DFH94DRAFT_206292 [Russula ochroleuca]
MRRRFTSSTVTLGFSQLNVTLSLYLRRELFGSRRQTIRSVSLGKLPSEEASEKKRKGCDDRGPVGVLQPLGTTAPRDRRHFMARWRAPIIDTMHPTYYPRVCMTCRHRHPIQCVRGEGRRGAYGPDSIHMFS